jgi:hypothetical protein
LSKKVGKLETAILCALFIPFIILHSSPELSIRTMLFFHGYAKAAFRTEIIKNDLYDWDAGRQYTIVEDIYDDLSGNQLSGVKVKRFLFIYISTFGEF